MHIIPTHLTQSSHQSFGLLYPAHMLQKLGWEVEQLRALEDHLDIRCVYQSINCALSAWHMTDWVFQFMTEAQREKYTPQSAESLLFKIAAATPDTSKWFKLRGDLMQAQLKIFRTRAQQASPAVRICRYIADASKHRYLTSNPDPKLHATVINWQPEESGKWTLPLVIDHGKEYRMPQLMASAHRFWSRYVNWQTRASEKK
ncbi:MULTISPECIES: hypothetical protein [unclassified Achromobacter]|uniref:hypothetical protein n=1 Tax=unclassified Achromobacter TaxID=2626865 RepID=UPI0036EC940A